MKNEIYKEIALQVGGSHYPEVGGDLLEKFGDLLLEKIIEVVENTPQTHAYTTYDKGLIESTIGKSVNHVRQTFDKPLIRKLPQENRSM